MRLCFAAAASLAVITVSPAASEVYTVTLGPIIVPPTDTFTPGLTYGDAGENGADFLFTLTQPMTLTSSSFTNSFIDSRGVFAFTSIGLYDGAGTGGTRVQTGSMGTVGSTHVAALDHIRLGSGVYTIAYRGRVTGAPAGVGSNITFAAVLGGVPEPASWALMILGFGAVGARLRRRPARRFAVRFAA